MALDEESAAEITEDLKCHECGNAAEFQIKIERTQIYSYNSETQKLDANAQQYYRHWIYCLSCNNLLGIEQEIFD